MFYLNFSFIYNISLLRSNLLLCKYKEKSIYYLSENVKTVLKEKLFMVGIPIIRQIL